MKGGEPKYPRSGRVSVLLGCHSTRLRSRKLRLAQTKAGHICHEGPGVAEEQRSGISPTLQSPPPRKRTTPAEEDFFNDLSVYPLPA